jgi:hypothetical protein
MIFKRGNISLKKKNFFLPEFEIDEFVDEFGGVGDRAAHIDDKLKEKTY